jgi:hypothetical protein
MARQTYGQATHNSLSWMTTAPALWFLYVLLSCTTAEASALLCRGSDYFSSDLTEEAPVDGDVFYCYGSCSSL